MASSLSSTPLMAAVRSKHPSFAACRSFSQSVQRAAGYVPNEVSVKQPAQPSMRTRGSELSRADLPQDIGLLPGTVVRPLWRDMPSIFTQPSERLRMEWLWMKTSFQNFLGLLAYTKWLNKGLPLRLKERRQVARDLHQQMYSAFADGNTMKLRKICCTGLANNLSSRINDRPKDEKVTWALEKYNRTPGTFLTGLRVVSDRATQIPELPNSGVRQVIVRITSRQSTGKVKVQPKNKRLGPSVPTETPVEPPAAPKQQDCTEYVVVQKLRWTGEEEPWRIWGHTTPMTVDNLQDAAFAPGLSAAERLELMKSEMMGKK
ncbi:hypothetical protein P170DRAFT_453761 [Aspergillus steynii IBT 23096]|uniref:Tim44-like domain-containing protein n=1 Tax=Aspergillus steynii IBT 23096 TaxID=1392250 RepID=A0A2I2GHP1_9EURO|nr:uncharacterized protein P170DRAFT_453761 [Aspergillus steynii IBT 23096]PLB52357.1 hypothetical protein P170DRAFT_453761 [Aspergillus steynii IBT 23096]